MFLRILDLAYFDLSIDRFVHKAKPCSVELAVGDRKSDFGICFQFVAELSRLRIYNTKVRPGRRLAGSDFEFLTAP